MLVAISTLACSFRAGGLNARLEGGRRRVEMARPEFQRSTARQHLHANLLMPGVHFLRQLPKQGLRLPGRGSGCLEISRAAAKCQPDQRRSQPGRDFVVGGKALEDTLRSGE